MFQLGLETDHIAQGVFFVILPQLYYRIRAFPTVRVGQPDRFHRAVHQRIRPAFGHYLHRQTAVEIIRLLKIVEPGLFPFQQGIDKFVVLFPAERAVDIIIFIAFIVAGLVPGDVKIYTVLIYDRRYRVIKRELFAAYRHGYTLRQRRGRQRPGSDYAQPLAFRRQLCYLF